eukprot:GHVU01230457.1.p1 GENE.GHVU01230457.1~~GHVU01230457.1.p1  ORF type:complete len:149 (+),score=8.39 GHVU01230457.1:165-611(+)
MFVSVDDRIWTVEASWTHTGRDTADESQEAPDHACGYDSNNANDGRSIVECKSDYSIHQKHATAPPSPLHFSIPPILPSSLLPCDAASFIAFHSASASISDTRGSLRDSASLTGSLSPMSIFAWIQRQPNSNPFAAATPPPLLPTYWT